MDWYKKSNIAKLRLVGGYSLMDFCAALREYYEVEELYSDKTGASIDGYEFSNSGVEVFNRVMSLGRGCGRREDAMYFDTSDGMDEVLERKDRMLSSITIEGETSPHNSYAVHAVLRSDINAWINRGWLEIVEPITETPAQAENLPKQETSKMANLKANLVTTAAANKTAAGQALALTVGKAGNKVVTSLIKPKLPIGTRGFADGFIGSLIAANLTAFAVNQFMPENKKAVVVTQAMLTAAMVQALDEFDIEGMLDDVMSKIKGGKVDQLLAASEGEELNLD